MPYPLVDDQGWSFSKAPRRCRAGWITARTTALCLRFDSPTLGPHFPIPRPIVLLSGCIASHRVTSPRVRLHHNASGCITSRRVVSHHVGSCHITLGHVTSHWVTSHCIGSRHITLGHVTSCWVTSHHIGSCCITSCRVALRCYQPYLVCYPSLLLFPFLHTLFLLFLRRFSLYLHTSLFSFCHCDPGCLPLTLTLPYPCHLSLHYF